MIVRIEEEVLATNRTHYTNLPLSGSIGDLTTDDIKQIPAGGHYGF
jgi:hypothetical protein